MNPMLKRLAAIACSCYQRLARKIKHDSRSFDQPTSKPTSPLIIQEDPFFQQQGLFFCSTFPEQPLRPNALSLSDSSQTDPFWYRLTGHAKGHYSLAIVNRALAAALYKNSHAQTCFIPFDDGLKKSVEQMPEDTEPTLKLAISNPIPLPSERRNQPVVSIVHHYPVIIDDEPADIRLIIFFWEESLVPAETISKLNDHFDAILVASSFVATVLRNSGCAKPIFVIPMGVDHVVDYSASLSPLPSLKHGERFRFLHVSSVFERKGPEFLLAAFIAQFSAQDPVELYIKTFPNPHNRIHEQLAHFLSTKPNPPRVIIDEAEVSSEALQALYRSAHTLVLPTRGEGFNLPAAEALALGLPVIVTGFGAQTDFCTTATASLIPFRFDVSHSHLNQGDGCWITPDVRTLAKMMQHSVDEVCCGSTDQRDQLNNLGQLSQIDRMNRTDQLSQFNQRRLAGHALMHSTYTWAQAAQSIGHALDWLTAQGAINHDVSIKHLRVTSQAEILTLISPLPKEDAIVISLQSHYLEIDLLNDISDAVLQGLTTFTKQGKILILEILFSLNATTFSQRIPSECQSQQANTFFKLFDRVLVKSVNDLNQLLKICEPRTLMVLPHFSKEQQDQNITTARKLRLKQMIKGLKYDRLFSQKQDHIHQ